MAKLKDVNTTDVRSAIALGCRTMQNVFNADDGHIPFFQSRLEPTVELSFSPHHSESHVPGRHLNALLNAKDAAGVSLDPRAIEQHRRAAFLAFSGPVPLSLNRPNIGGRPVNFSPHNLREGLHALYALTRFRGDDAARRLAERCIVAVLDLWKPDAGWDVARLRDLGLNYQECQGFLHGEARMLGPLVKYYRAAGYAPALELALILKEKAVREFFLADGEYEPARFITRHSHSITCTLSSLAQLADLLGDASLLLRVKAFYDRGLWQMRDDIGWSPEIVGQQGSDHGEANNSGDILETALILGRWGWPEYYEDAERILRCHLLPSQLRDISWVQDPPNPEGRDGLRDVAGRHVGAWGMPAPYGHKSVGAGRGNLCFNMDIVGGVVGSLCEAYRETVRRRPAGLWVNLLFDHVSDTLRMESPYTHEALALTPAQSGPLFVRLPSWVEPAEVNIEGDGGAPLWTNGYLCLPRVAAGATIRLRFPLREREITLCGELHIQPIRARLRGDSVLAMENFGAPLTFFD